MFLDRLIFLLIVNGQLGNNEVIMECIQKYFKKSYLKDFLLTTVATSYQLEFGKLTEKAYKHRYPRYKNKDKLIKLILEINDFINLVLI